MIPANDAVNSTHTANSVGGFVAPEFREVAEAFAHTLEFNPATTSVPHGSALAVVQRGRTVVNLWAGERVAGQVWQAKTRQCVFSVSKAVASLCILQAVDAGALNLDQPVAFYWPEFGVHGKDRVTVREALAHRAGVPVPSHPLTHEELAAWEPYAHAVAEAKPLWEPGTAYFYHAITHGAISGEILRRTTGMLPDQWFAEHLAQPLNLHASFGLAPGESLDDLALFAPPPSAPAVNVSPQLADLTYRSGFSDAAYAPHLFAAANRDEYYREVNPAANFVTNAEDLATLMCAAAGGVATGGAPLIQPATLADALRPVSRGPRFLMDSDDGKVWGCGLMPSCAARPMCGPGSFGHDGAAGQLGFGNTEHELGFAYLTSLPGGAGDPRLDALAAAVRSCIENTRG